MKLYYSPGACSLAPHIVACEAGLDIELCRVNLKNHQLENGDNFFDINPKGPVPALQLTSGEVLTEGPAIVQFLARQKPAAKLMPEPDHMTCYQLLSWMYFLSSEVHKSFAPLFWRGSDSEQAAARKKLHKHFNYIEQQFDRDYLLDDQLTIADPYLFTIYRWNTLLGVDTGAWPRLNAFIERMNARPAVQAALAAEGLN